MNPRNEGPSLLAIGIDALEFSRVASLMAEGRLPTMAALRAHGCEGRVVGPADVGSGAVWPTFVTGHSPKGHGFYCDLAWQPEQMRLVRASFAHLQPFWRRLANHRISSAVLDVPFVTPASVGGCAEILDWGAHDWLGGTLRVTPDSLAGLVRAAGTHPFSRHVVTLEGPHDEPGLRRIERDCLDGARRRGSLALRLVDAVAPNLMLVVFSEVHRAGHYLWDHRRPGGDLRTGRRPAALDDVVAEVDRQIGRLIEKVGEATTVFVFSLHGMKAATGVVNLLDTLLETWGFGVRVQERSQAGPRLGHVVASARGWAMARARPCYHRCASRAAVMRWARPEADLGSWDWSRTAAFPLPTDQHGWIRINLVGRESAGTVAPGAYEETCASLEGRLHALRTHDGHPVVDRVIRLAGDAREAMGLALPDLVVHWSDATRDVALRIQVPDVTCPPRALTIRGQHALSGGYIFRAGRRSGSDRPPAEIEAGQLGTWFTRWAGI